MKRKRGRPRIINFACPKCGQCALLCNRSKLQGGLRARYYICRSCGHHGVLVSGADKSWWKDTSRLMSMVGKCE